MSIQEALSHREPLVISTTDENGKPHSNVMLSLGVFDGKILIGLCFLKNTHDNLLRNKSVSVITVGGKGWYRITGTVEIFDSGKYLDLANSLSRPPMPQKAMLISMDEIWDLDKGEAVKY